MIVRCGCLVAVALAAGCSSTAAPHAAPPSSAPPAATTTTSSAPAARTVNWFDLTPGDCLADPPPVDPTVIAVTVVDCTSPHHAEVYLRAPLAVNTAITDIAGRKCDEGFTEYTGEPVGSGTFGVTYLIDSNQNRTSSNPDPSTVICLLEAVDGSVLTVPARR
ncbi:hypothetical protein H7J06_10555 [Mycobacterium hodleri]|uniref:hypothetical protein n=1 Tax=Mycolicibacterium hodleri TaxID=49897 RepID=UPI0021F2E772|nr:hypothetical protein [Mycolicibacterium hodleri]MCV7133425.1 hypothetical protein [Mycolicibacterium hodleri]